MKKTDLTLIILTYNTQFWLKKMLQSLKKEYLPKTKLKVTVVVVDNNSTDNTTTMVKKQFRWVELIELKDNLGFAAANNIALEKYKSRYFMLLNSDTEFTNFSNLDTLVDFMDKTKSAGVITPRLEFFDGQIDPACHRGEPTPWASFTYFFGLEKILGRFAPFGQYHQKNKNLKTIHTIDACSGAAMLIRNKAMKKVGLLDDRFFMYAEDLDWCKRFREEGWHVVYHPGVSIVHHKHKSGISADSQVLSRKTKGYFYDTMLSYYDKHYKDKYPGWTRWLVQGALALKKGLA